MTTAGGGAFGGMLGGSASLLFQAVGWHVMPALLSRMLLQGLATLRLIQPAKTQETAASYQRRATLAVILGYLLYTVVQQIQQLPPSHYAILNLSTDASEDDIRRSFRALARRYHPDKLDPQDFVLQGQVQDYFLRIRHATEVLSDPVKRFAYDR